MQTGLKCRLRPKLPHRLIPVSARSALEKVFSMHKWKFETRESAVENRGKGKDVRHIELRK